MKTTKAVLGLSVLLLALCSGGSVWAETIELVTYYPSAATTGDLHANSLRVGSNYSGVTPPADGQVFIFDRLGIGPDFTAAAPPTQVLEVEGNALLNSPATALYIADRGANTNYNGLQLLTAGAVKWTIGSRNNGTEHLHIFSDADNVTRLFIEQGTGNVGIGTTAPATEFEVVSTAVVQPRGIMSSQYNTGTSSALFIGRKGRGTRAAPTAVADGDWLGGFVPEAYDGAAYQQTGWIGYRVNGAVAGGSVPSDLVVFTGTSGQGTEKMRVTSGGNVGIGTTTPGAPLEISSASTIVTNFLLNNTSAGGTRWNFQSVGSGVAGRTGNLEIFRLGTNNGIVLTPTGFVGIGENTPDARLTLRGASGDSSGGLRLYDHLGNYRSLYMTSNDSTLGFINQVGNVATLSATGVWTNASDRAYKKNIRTVPYGLSEVLRLKPRRYEMKADGTPQVGFIAQEVREVIPEVVYGEEPKLTLSYDQMLPVVVRAVQQLKAENDDLRAWNDRLETRVKALEGK